MTNLELLNHLVGTQGDFWDTLDWIVKERKLILLEVKELKEEYDTQ